MTRPLEMRSQETEFLGGPHPITLGSATNCVVFGPVVDKQSSFPSLMHLQKERRDVSGGVRGQDM